MAKYNADEDVKQKQDTAASEVRIKSLRDKGMSERDATVAGLVNMKRSDAEDGNKSVAPAAPDKGPKYPYGLKFNLEDEDLTKLGFDELPEVNDVCKFTIETNVDSVSSNQNSDGKNHDCVSFQITDMSWDGKESESPAEEEAETPADEDKETI